MSPARLRLVLLALLLPTLAIVLSVTDVVDVDALRRWVQDAGPAAPVAYVALSVLLGALLVPGPLLTGAAGLLFGAASGTALALLSSVLSAVVALLVGRWIGRAGARELAGEWAEALEGLLVRHGLLAVIGQRLVPGVPDAPLSYLAGALGIRAWQIAAGTAVGSAPRTFAYAAFGASVGDPRSPLALAGGLTWVLAALVGAEVARRAAREVRTRRRLANTQRSPDAAGDAAESRS